MIEHGDALSDSIAVLALGALSTAEARPILEHLATCDRCRSEYAGYRATANLVGYAAELEPGALDEMSAARLKSRVMRAVREDTKAAPSARPAGRGARPWYAYAAAAAAIAFALLTSFDNLSLRSQHDRDRERLAQLEARAQAAQHQSVAAIQENDAAHRAARERDARALAALRVRSERDAARVAALQTQIVAQSRNSAAASRRARELATQLAAVVAPGSKHFGVPGGEIIASGGRIIIALQHGPPLPAGKVYQAWTVQKNLKGVNPSITFTPDANGVAVVELPEPSAKVVAVALSVEPPGGSKAPTTKPAFIRPLL